jgi:hypothetical protein
LRRVQIRHGDSTDDERAAAWPCDAVLPEPDDVLFRAIDVDAPVAVTFRWLCQLRVAPYSYDWLDNFGRRSPRQLTPNLERLAIGQRVATIFELVDFAVDDHVTIRSTRGWFGNVALTYRVRPIDAAHTRLTVKLLVRHRRDPLGVLWRYVLPAGDYVMMHKQLRTLAQLAASTT